MNILQYEYTHNEYITVLYEDQRYIKFEYNNMNATIVTPINCLSIDTMIKIIVNAFDKKNKFATLWFHDDTTLCFSTESYCGPTGFNIKFT